MKHALVILNVACLLGLGTGMLASCNEQTSRSPEAPSYSPAGNSSAPDSSSSETEPKKEKKGSGYESSRGSGSY